MRGAWRIIQPAHSLKPMANLNNQTSGYNSSLKLYFFLDCRNSVNKVKKQNDKILICSKTNSKVAKICLPLVGSFGRTIALIKKEGERNNKYQPHLSFFTFPHLLSFTIFSSPFFEVWGYDRSITHFTRANCQLLVCAGDAQKLVLTPGSRWEGHTHA